MQFQISFRHMDPSDSLRDFVERKIERLVKDAEKIIEVQVVFEQERLDTVVEIMTNLHGHTLKAKERDGDPYAAVDLALDKFERQIVKVRERIRSRRHDVAKEA